MYQNRIGNIALRPLAAAVLACLAANALAQSEEKTLSAISIKEKPSVAEKYQLPATTESVTAEKLAETVNVVNTEDALKYMPSIMVRKRHIGDTYAPMTTRTSGPGQSARSLIFADGVLLSALIGNNNGSASPRWSMVAPEEIERVDVMYGPFSAAYAGNSVGAVVEIATRMPDQFEASVKATGAIQDFSLYGTDKNLHSEQLSATLGNRSGDLSYWFSANHLESQSNPISFVTATANNALVPTKTVTGGYVDRNKLGAPILVVGAGGLESKTQDNFKVKLGYDFTPSLRATYAFGYFQNNVHSGMQTYLQSAGAPVYSGKVAFNGQNYDLKETLGAGMYNFVEEHTMHSLSLKSNTRGEWDWEAVGSVYNFGKDEQRSPGTATAALGSGAGTNTVMNGTGWNNLDLKGFWRPQGIGGTHQVSFGAHHDYAELDSTKYNVAEWKSGGNGAVATDARGKTQTEAVWLQDVWKFAPTLRATLGGRYEHWRAFDGMNYSAGLLNVAQPELSATNFSPKASLAWEASNEWLITGSLGKAYRYPTVSEMYQAVATPPTITVPNPNLKPEQAVSGELAFERSTEQGKLRISLFQENLRDALISYNSTLGATNASYIQNVDKVKAQGVELSALQNDVLVRGLELSGSLTFVDSRILSAPGFKNVASVLTDVSGKVTPNIPRWRATAVATYRPDDQWAYTLAGRYSDRLWTTMDNTDTNPGTYQGFEHYFVADARVHYKVNKQWSASVGVDNLNNRKYFWFHPFPQRTLLADVKFAF
jgi:iron complex outermembrane receptor protein